MGLQVESKCSIVCGQRGEPDVGSTVTSALSLNIVTNAIAIRMHESDGGSQRRSNRRKSRQLFDNTLRLW